MKSRHTRKKAVGPKWLLIIDLHMIRESLVTGDLSQTSRELPVNQVVIDRVKDRLNAGTTLDLVKWV